MAVVASTLGCALNSKGTGLPESQKVVRGQLVVHSDFHIPTQHRLLDELEARRRDISSLLKIPHSDEPINVFLFEDKDQFQTFMIHSHPEFPNRRAFFVKTDTSLQVYAFWGARVGEDLRHEVTHAYVHSVVPNLPLWLDEGIAEYFEVARGKGGVNGPHIYQLSHELSLGNWKPDLARLESLTSASQLKQMDYAESWLWVHFLLTGDQQSRGVIQALLRQLRDTGVGESILPVVESTIPEVETQLIMHLKMLAK
ncbi:MAG: DUF1570 domain-containing protein [Mariniblastus sp.]|nr:DUF1570 domain-containing protein [Mariniblastus sp.]